MKGMLLRRWEVVLAVCGAVLVCCETTQKSDDSGLADDVEDLRITSSDIQGWSDTARGGFSGYGVFIGDYCADPSNPINGQCIEYTSRNVKKTIFQFLTAPATPYPLMLDIYAMDFGTPENARAMFEEKKSQSPPATDRLPGYPDSLVAVRKSDVGCKVFVHFGKFYIELAFTNYQNADEAMEDAKLFVDIYRRKILG